MRDFDSERKERNEQRLKEMGDRTFTLCGEQFTYRAVSSYTVLEKVATTQNLNTAELIASIEEVIIAFLEPGQGERFLAVARNDEDPLTFADLNDLMNWLAEVQVARPTEPLSPSTSGDESTSTSSKADKSSAPAVGLVA